MSESNPNCNASYIFATLNNKIDDKIRGENNKPQTFRNDSSTLLSKLVGSSLSKNSYNKGPTKFDNNSETNYIYSVYHSYSIHREGNYVQSNYI